MKLRLRTINAGEPSELADAIFVVFDYDGDNDGIDCHDYIPTSCYNEMTPEATRGQCEFSSFDEIFRILEYGDETGCFDGESIFIEEWTDFAWKDITSVLLVGAMVNR